MTDIANSDIATQLGLTVDSTIHFIESDLRKTPCKFRGVKGNMFIVSFDNALEETQEVHSSRLAFDSSPIFIKAKPVKQASEQKPKAAPMKVVCQFSVDDFTKAFPKAQVYYKTGALFDHPNFEVMSHIAILDDNTKTAFNSYNMIIFGKLQADEYDKLKNGIWTKSKSSIPDLGKLIKKLTESGYVKFEQKK